MRKFAVIPIVGLGLAAATTAACAGVAAADTGAGAGTGTGPAAATSAPIVPAIDDGDPTLKYEQAGRVVTITRNAAAVATVTLTSADYSANSAKVVLSVVAARPFTVDPVMFTLYDLAGWENDPEQVAPVRFETGTGSLTLTFTGTPGRPEAVGWVPQDGEAAVAVWERG